MAEVQVTIDGIAVDGELKLTWSEVDHQRANFQLENTILVKCGFKYGRYHDFEDATIFSQARWNKIKPALEGFTAFYSEFCGHHSSVDITFWTDDAYLKEITDPEEIRKFFDNHGWSESNLDIIEDAVWQAIDNGHLDKDFNDVVLPTAED